MRLLSWIPNGTLSVSAQARHLLVISFAQILILKYHAPRRVQSKISAILSKKLLAILASLESWRVSLTTSALFVAICSGDSRPTAPPAGHWLPRESQLCRVNAIHTVLIS